MFCARWPSRIASCFRARGLLRPERAHKLERCNELTDAEYEAALRRRDEYRERAAAALEGIDVLLTPTLAFVAPPAFKDDLQIRDAVIRLTYPFNALGWPALALPCGPAEHGLPASVQLIAPAGADARVLAAAALLERELAVAA